MEDRDDGVDGSEDMSSDLANELEADLEKELAQESGETANSEYLHMDGHVSRLFVNLDVMRLEVVVNRSRDHLLNESLCLTR